MQQVIYYRIVNGIVLLGLQQSILLKNRKLGISIANINNQVGHQALTNDNIDSKIAKPILVSYQAFCGPFGMRHKAEYVTRSIGYPGNII